MNLIRIFTTAFTLSLMTISCLGQTTFYAADYSINKEKAQDQYYKVEQNKDTIIIQERGIFLTNPSIYAFSESKMDSLGYISIEIAFDNGEIKSNVTVNRASHNNKLYYSFLNGKLVDSLMIADSVTLLFDGPNPTFDALNSRFLQHNKTESVTLGLINWISGTLSTEQAYYIIGKSEVAIHKKETKRISFLFLNENDILPHSCYQNKESYKFRKVETLPIQLKK